MFVCSTDKSAALSLCSCLSNDWLAVQPTRNLVVSRARTPPSRVLCSPAERAQARVLSRNPRTTRQRMKFTEQEQDWMTLRGSQKRWAKLNYKTTYIASKALNTRLELKSLAFTWCDAWSKIIAYICIWLTYQKLQKQQHSRSSILLSYAKNTTRTLKDQANGLEVQQIWTLSVKTPAPATTRCRDQNETLASP